MTTMTTDETEADDNARCVACNATLPDDHDDEFGEQCQACYAASHFHCLA